jgi:DNA excision repair protein ERCC-4
MRRRSPTLIQSPLAWHMGDAPVAPPAIPALAERGGTQLKAPRGTILVDTREQNPFDFSRFEGWFAGVEKKALKLGDYSVAGLEDRCVVERKALPDLVHSLTVNRPIFINRLRRICSYPHRLLVITATLSQVKTGYPYSAANPNHIFQSAIALLAGLTVPFVCADNEALGEELVASYLYQVHLYHWLEANDYGRFLADGDL